MSFVLKIFLSDIQMTLEKNHKLFLTSV